MTYKSYSAKQTAKGHNPMTKAEWDQLFADAAELEASKAWYAQDRINHPEAY